MAVKRETADTDFLSGVMSENYHHSENEQQVPNTDKMCLSTD